MQFFARLAHGAGHMPPSGRLLRVYTAFFTLTVTLYALTTAVPLWLLALAGTAAAVTVLISCLELHEAARECEQSHPEDTNDADDDSGSGLGYAA